MNGLSFTYRQLKSWWRRARALELRARVPSVRVPRALRGCPALTDRPTRFCNRNQRINRRPTNYGKRECVLWGDRLILTQNIDESVCNC